MTFHTNFANTCHPRHYLAIFILTIFFIIPSISLAQNDPKLAGKITWHGQLDLSKANGPAIGGKVEKKLIIKALKESKVVAQLEIKRPTFPQLFLLGPKNLLNTQDPWSPPYHLQLELWDMEGKVRLYQSQLSGPYKAGTRGILFNIE